MYLPDELDLRDGDEGHLIDKAEVIVFATLHRNGNRIRILPTPAWRISQAPDGAFVLSPKA